VYCKCKPHVALSLEGEYLLKNWTSHKQSCELCKLAVREACALSTAVQLALHGIPVTTNTLQQRSKWTDYEKRRLYQSLTTMARWLVYSSTGSIFAKGCLGLTTSLTHTCSGCAAVATLPGFKRAVRDARARAQLPVDKFTAAITKKMAHTPTILSEIAAAKVKANLARPAVIKLLSSKAMYGPVGAYLSLFQQAQQGDLDDQESFVAICEQFTDKVTRNKDPTGHAIHGIRYHPTFIKYSTLMRSFGPRSGAQYELLASMTGGISPRQLRYVSINRSHHSVHGPGPWTLLPDTQTFSAVQFGERMNYTGPWICAGDGTKLRPLLTTSTEYSEKGSAHVVGSTLPLGDVLFKSSEEQTKIITAIDGAKAIATQVWVLAIKIPLPGMPLFSVTFVANQGTMKAVEYRDLHLQLRSLCGKAGLKLLVSGADGAKAEVNAQQMMMNVDTPQRLSYTNTKYGLFMSAPVYSDTGPHIAVTDPDHARKTIRNNFLYGTHLLSIGCLFLCHAVLMSLLAITGCVLYVKDIFNPDKQDDGAARRLFINALSSFLVDSKGELIHPDFGGLFFILLVLAHLEHYPNVPFMPWHYGSHFLEHFYGVSRSFISDFSFGQLIEMYKHIALRQMILASGQYSVKKEKDSNNGYTFEFVDSKLTPKDIAALKQIPSRADIDRACETAWNEAAALMSQFCKIRIPSLPLTPSDLHPQFRTANGPGRVDEDTESDEE
ncbi:hypothetical protein GGX14DRAFT_311719, partial [Mycena pura]